MKFYCSVVEVTIEAWVNGSTDKMQPTGHGLDPLDKANCGCWNLHNASDNSFQLLLGTFNTSEE